jgi:hypothetical protein
MFFLVTFCFPFFLCFFLLPSLSLSTKHTNGLSTKYTNGYNSPPHIQVHSFLLCIYITPYLILGEG